MNFSLRTLSVTNSIATFKFFQLNLTLTDPTVHTSLLLNVRSTITIILPLHLLSPA